MGVHLFSLAAYTVHTTCFERGGLLTKFIRNYYAGGNTAKGFHHFFPSNLEGLERIFILKGGPGTGKSTMMKAIGKKWENRYEVEYIHCASDWGSIDGVIIPQIGVGVVDGTAPHVLEPECPGAVEEYINLGEAWDSRKLRFHKAEIQHLNKQIKNSYDKAYSIFARALEIHDEWEEYYIDALDREKANHLTKQLIQHFFGSIQLNKKPEVRHRFLGAATPEGPKDFIPNLTEEITSRYFIKGRPGSGKSTMLKKLAAEAQKRGVDAEIYHCGFDPNSLDMVIFRELDIAIFDSTSPHEHFPTRGGDKIIDMYEELITAGTDEKYEESLKHVAARYKSQMQEGTRWLKAANTHHKKMEAIYKEAVDFSVVEQKQHEIEKEISAMEEWVSF